METRNLLIAMVLSIIILATFQTLFPPTKVLHKPSPKETSVTVGERAPTKPAPKVKSREEVLSVAPRVPIDTPKLHGSIDLVGARFDDLKLAEYHDTIDPKSAEIVMFSPPDAPTPHFVDIGWAPADKTVRVPDETSRWEISGDNKSLTTKSAVELVWDNGSGLRFTRVLSVDDDYLFTVKQSVENYGAATVTLLPFASTTKLGLPAATSYSVLFEGVIGEFDGVLSSTKYGSLKPEEPVEMTARSAWLGFTDKYWLTALVPATDAAIKGRFTHTKLGEVDRFQADYVDGERVIPPGGTAEASTRFFAGPKVVKLLKAYEVRDGIPNLIEAVDWGWFWFLTKPMFTALDFFNSATGNFGVAILLLTVLVKGLFFPLANKSYKSLSKMKLLGPQLAEIKVKFADDRQRMHQETMALYKKEGASPISGCLPIFIQIPVFFSLYKVLFVTIEMRHAPFFGWIKDLSAPDPTTIFNLFGYIPWDPPSYLMIGGWPLVMGLTMYFQQQLNPKPADEMTAKIMGYLPFIFTFTLSSFPAGMVIYWAWNNTLSATQQWLIMRRNGAA